MSNQLVDDFINNNSKKPDTTIPAFLPMFVAPVGIPVQPIIDMSPEERLSVFREFIGNIKSICNMFNDMSKLGTGDIDPETVVNGIRNALNPYAESIGLNIDMDTDNTAVATCCLMAQVYGFLTEIVRFMSIEYNLSYDVDNDTVVDTIASEDVEDPFINASDNKEDDEFLNMLAAELVGATDGVEFTDVELTGESNE